MTTRLDRAVGAVLGSAAGDALGAPYEFGPAGQLTARGEEMRGGGGWDPGEATDDTQMAVLVGESLLERGGLELPDIFARFRRWAAGQPKDIGLQTEDVLTNGEPWVLAAALHFQVNTRAAGFADAVRAAVDLGGDTDTVAAVTGALAGARYGEGAVPESWTAVLHVPLPGFGERVLAADDLRAPAQRLAAAGRMAAAGSR
ncbi:ADP-ribosylglycohydrolase family protein [Streptomyces sp. NPDC005533]|uniref:ADP-ribosylglycohydrolase family protein n=1 Tax=Streptomyces sp. NPDC005533 TaxID=3364723 RepID=UPI00367AD16C